MNVRICRLVNIYIYIIIINFISSVRSVSVTVVIKEKKNSMNPEKTKNTATAKKTGTVHIYNHLIILKY